MTRIPSVLGWEVKKAVEYLHQQGFETVMLRTGRMAGQEKVVAQRWKNGAVELVYAAFQPPQF